jgi:hypothetical protein
MLRISAIFAGRARRKRSARASGLLLVVAVAAEAVHQSVRWRSLTPLSVFK